VATFGSPIAVYGKLIACRSRRLVNAWQAISLPYIFLICSVVSAADAPAPELPKGVISVPLRLEANRAFITVTLNGSTSCECVIDTGSEVTLLNKARVQMKNLRLAGSDTFQGDFVGAIDAQRAMLETLAIGDHVTKNVAIGVIDHGPGKKLQQIEMVLGMDVLAKLRFTLDFAANRVLLWPAKSELPRAPATLERQRLALQPGAYSDEKRPRVLGMLNGKHKVCFLVDSAADNPTFVAIKKPADYGLEPEGNPVAMMAVNDGRRRELPMHAVTFAKLEFEKLCLESVPGRVLDASTVAGPIARQDIVTSYNLLGMPFLKNFSAVHLDGPARCVYLEREKQK
jgi:predicted aspartyl protease